MWAWEMRWGGEFGLPPRLIHTTCGKSLHSRLVCARCESSLNWRDIVFKPGAGANRYPAPPA
jgi:hypothetical protein